MVEAASLPKDVLERFTRLVLEEKTLRGIREEMPELPSDDVPLIRLMLDILDSQEAT